MDVLTAETVLTEAGASLTPLPPEAVHQLIGMVPDQRTKPAARSVHQRRRVNPTTMSFAAAVFVTKPKLPGSATIRPPACASWRSQGHRCHGLQARLPVRLACSPRTAVNRQRNPTLQSREQQIRSAKKGIKDWLVIRKTARNGDARCPEVPNRRVPASSRLHG